MWQQCLLSGVIVDLDLILELVIRLHAVSIGGSLSGDLVVTVLVTMPGLYTGIVPQHDTKKHSITTWNWVVNTTGCGYSTCIDCYVSVFPACWTDWCFRFGLGPDAPGNLDWLYFVGNA